MNEKIEKVAKELGWEFVQTTPSGELCARDDLARPMWWESSGLTDSGEIALQRWLLGEGWELRLCRDKRIELYDRDANVYDGVCNSLLDAVLWAMEQKS